MNYAVIDVGSNSVRLAAFSYDEATKKLDCYLNEREMLGLAAYISDGRLNEMGIQKLVNVLKRYKALVARLQISHFYTLATASIRNVENTQEIVAQIDAMCGITMEVLSGTEEAECDFAGVMPEIAERNGVIVDVGGGSTEIILFEDGEQQQAVSIPIGSLQLYASQVEGFIPTPLERKKMKQVIKEQLDGFVWPVRKHYPVLYGIGGTCRCTLRLAQELFEEEQNQAEQQTVSFELIHRVLKSIKKDLQKQEDYLYLKRVYQAVPERLCSVLPGLMILEEIADRVGAEDLKICLGGVREGYLYRKMRENAANGGIR
jgi:exopolyphosphatase/guanosine-5'-triphosphate,3'-diphosphate pyrophosphatase